MNTKMLLKEDKRLLEVVGNRTTLTGQGGAGEVFEKTGIGERGPGLFKQKTSGERGGDRGTKTWINAKV